ncbi:MAG: glycoside hydrolase family 99-like domain-containing protein [Bacteroidota bacterium]
MAFQTISETSLQNKMSQKKLLRPVALYLPQFHPIPENDKFWGKGFTEWTNVTKAKPLFSNHYQPHQPTDLGYYDLRLPEILIAQAKMAISYGIDGFCFYHYWFNGKKVLEKPIEQMLRSKKPDFPFCLCWANENWTRRWDGLEQEVLLQQKHSTKDDEAHFEYLLPFFKDERYIKVNNKPVFFIYRTELFPNIKSTTRLWRNLAQKNGFDLYLINVEGHKKGVSPELVGCDAGLFFQPDWLIRAKRLKANIFKKILHHSGLYSFPSVSNGIFDYPAHVYKTLKRKKANYKQYPSVVPMWDNTARRKEGATIFLNSSPKMYEYWLSEEIKRFTPYSKDENLIIINAWNEWAEGNHLEPCQKYGHAYLEATKRAIDKYG